MKIAAFLLSPYRSLGLTLICLLTATSSLAADLYRYRNEKGNLVINHTVPPHLAQKGYERLDTNGRVLERVAAFIPRDEPASPPEKTEPDPAPETALSQKKQDLYLLASFSTVEEISATRDRKLAQLLREINILANKTEEIDQERLAAEQEAAQYQRGGKDIPDELKKRLESVVERKQKALTSTESRQTEYAQTEKLYASHIERFKELKGLPQESSDAEVEKTDSETAPAIDPPSAQSAGD